MIDRKKTCRIFEEAVNKGVGKIAVYGLGKYANILANSFADSILCFCDGKKETGEFFNKPIYPLFRLPALGIKTLVIAAGIKAEKIVFERIVDFCQNEGISLYGVQTGSMDCIGKELSDLLCGEKLKRRLWDEIERHEVISFDIFDTLVMRKTLYPTDIFDIVEYRAKKNGVHLPDGFKNYRNQAEVSVDRKKQGLKGIYKTLETMIPLTEAESKVVMQMETDAEKEAIIPREGMVEAFNYAKSLNKKILLVSDMYLPSEFLQSVLLENGINGFDKLYVSEEYGTHKAEDLFEIVKAENPASSYLHIGDNPEADGWGARRCGVDSLLIKSAISMFETFEESKAFKYIISFNERLLTGLLLAATFNNPFNVNDKGQRDIIDVPDFAKLFLAPLASSFIIWMIHEIKRHSFDKILFAARDGYLFRQLYDKAIKEFNFSNMPKSVYFYASRKLYIGFAIKTEADIVWMENKSKMWTKNFVKDIFDVELKVDGENIDEENILSALFNQKEQIFKSSSKKRENFRKYIEKTKLDYYGHYAFFEMTSKGTSQYALCHSFFPNLYGLFMQRYHSTESFTMGKVETFIPQGNAPMLINNVFEFVFASPEPSAKCAGENGDIVFNKEVRTESEIAESMAAQNSVKEYFADFIKFAVPEENMTSRVGQQILSLYRSAVFAGGVALFNDKAISNDLEMGGGKNAPCLKADEV